MKNRRNEEHLRITAPDGSDAGELSISDCWAFFKERHRKLFEANPPPPVWGEARYGAFKLEFSGFCPECSFGVFNGRHVCPDD
ncbi:MAG: hypothetical protein IRY99_09275 [Isosphaeraceae bacterium]|nr:hypothetical protein [Isosphaeraceae bacterium]